MSSSYLIKPASYGYIQDGIQNIWQHRPIRKDTGYD